MSRLLQVTASTLALSAAGAVAAPAATSPTPIKGSTTISGAYGVSLLKPPSSVPCSALEKNDTRYDIVLGAKYAKGAKAQTVEAILTSGPGTTTPTYLKPPSKGSGWVYGNLPVSKCGGQQYTVRYKIVRKGGAAKRVSVTFTVTGSD